MQSEASATDNSASSQLFAMFKMPPAGATGLSNPTFAPPHASRKRWKAKRQTTCNANLLDGRYPGIRPMAAPCVFFLNKCTERLWLWATGNTSDVSSNDVGQSQPGVQTAQFSPSLKYSHGITVTGIDPSQPLAPQHLRLALTELRHSHPGGQGSWEVHIDLAVSKPFCNAFPGLLSRHLGSAKFR